MLQRLLSALAALIVLFGGSQRSSAQNLEPASGWELLAGTYLTDVTNCFLGKAIKGENVFEAFGRSLYEAVPAAALHHTSKVIVGHDWWLALPAQVVAQKGNHLVQRSIWSENVFALDELKCWEVDYLLGNFRLGEGAEPRTRLNVYSTLFATRLLVEEAVTDRTHDLLWGQSLMTGTLVFKGNGLDRRDDWQVGFASSNVVEVFTEEDRNDEKYFREVFVYNMMFQQGAPLWDTLMEQGFYQSRTESYAPNWLRFDGGMAVTMGNDLLQRGYGFPSVPSPYEGTLYQWEAYSYASLGGWD